MLRDDHGPRVGERSRIYAFVDSVNEAVSDRPRSRMSLQLDAVDADAFDDSAGAVNNEGTLLLVRVSTTANRLAELFAVEAPTEGKWFEMRLARQRFLPRAWRLPLVGNYVPEPALNVVGMAALPETSDIVVRLQGACTAPDAETVENVEQLTRLLSTASRGDLRVTALDVGQAACVAFSRGSQTVGYFDVGAPTFWNQKSFPRKLDHDIARDGLVILSHWDIDHFGLALRHRGLMSLDWYAPKQPVGPNAAHFQKSLGARLKFISADVQTRGFALVRCTGTSTTDRNSTGYVLRVDRTGVGIVLPGDADYQWIPVRIARGADRIMMPHHGAAGTSPPSPNGGNNPLAVASYGIPNSYHHPNEAQIAAHQRAGWRVRRTAAHGSPPRPRGNRTLFP